MGEQSMAVLGRPAAPVSAGGRDEAVAALFDEHYPGLCRLATILLSDRDAAHDVVSEAFVQTYAGWWRLRRPDQAQRYLRSAVVNGCRSRHRRRRSEDRGNRTTWVSEDRALDRAGPAPERTGETLAVLDAVRALPERQREAVVLRYYEDLSEADIALTLGCSVGTVKSQLSKARASLARRLAEPGSEEI